jgi:protein ImuA
MNTNIAKLFARKWLWTGVNSSTVEAVASGYSDLDEQLAGGFPQQGVIDLKTDMGIGELRLLLNYLVQQQQDRHLLLIAPPVHINAEFLASQGINTALVVVIHPDNEKQSLWCAEQSLQSGCCAAVLLWQTEVEISQVRRLMLASEKGAASLWLLRQGIHQTSQISLPVPLSLSLFPATEGIRVAVDKRRGGQPVKAFSVNMNCLWPQLTDSPLPNNVIPLSSHSGHRRVS